MPVKNPIATISAGLIGAGLMYLLDPVMGPRRRGTLRDKLIHFSRVGKRATNNTARDLGNRIHGVVAEARHILNRESVNDDILVERVRSRVGRVVSHLGSLEISVNSGRVTLSGSIPDEEHDRLLRAVREIRGVNEIQDRLQRRAA